MDIGVIIFPTDKAIQPIQLAKEVESRGFESLWFPEHSHIPSSRETPWGGRAGAPPLPEEYWRSHDQFVALTACAAVTTKLQAMLRAPAGGARLAVQVCAPSRACSGTPSAAQEPQTPPRNSKRRPGTPSAERKHTRCN